MLGCNTVCPKCRHEFQCCPASSTPQCCSTRRLLLTSGGGCLLQPPQVSPSAPVTFVLPFPTVPRPQLPQPEARPEAELRRLAEGVRVLRETGWYHEGLTWQQSQAALRGARPGTFLVRDSSDPRYLYSLSVQTDQGPTSVRLHYSDGKFRLDAEPQLAPAMPTFDTVPELVAHYVRCCSGGGPGDPGGGGGGGQVWVDQKGCVFSRILLRRPLYREAPRRLQHLARLAVHRALAAGAAPRLALLPPPHARLELPASLARYLAEYPYPL